MEKKINVAIYSGVIPAPNFIENFIKLIVDEKINVYLFGNGNSVIINSNIKTFFTPQGKLNIICFVFSIISVIYLLSKNFKLVQIIKFFQNQDHFITE